MEAETWEQDSEGNWCYLGDDGVKQMNNAGGDNSWTQDSLERGWEPLTKEAYDEKVAEAKLQGTYFPVIHTNEFDLGKVILGSVTGVDTVILGDTIIVSQVSKYMGNYVYSNSTLTNSSSRI